MDQKDETTGSCISDTSKDLLNAFQYKNISKFKNILKAENTNVNKTYGDPHYGTILDIACREKGNVEYINELLKFGADPNKINETRKKAPLHFATLAGDEEAVKALLVHKGTDINIKDNTGSTALHLAVKNKHTEIVNVLLENENIDINALNRKGNTPLHEAALQENNMELIAHFLSLPDIDLDVGSNYGQTLRELISDQYPELLNKLPHEIIPKKQLTTDQMFTMLRNHNINSFVSSLKANTDKLEANDGLHTFLQYCCEFGIHSAVPELLEHGANPNTTHSANLHTPLMIAASKGFCSIVLLLVNNEKTTYEAVNNETALHCTIKGSSEERGLAEFEIEKNYISCLKILLNQVPKLDINQRDNRGNTALHYAAKQGEHEMIIMLLNAGAYIGICNKNNEPACSDISYKTFITYLDGCIYTNEKLSREDTYEIIFNYKCLIPFEKKTKNSTNSLMQQAIIIEQENGRKYNCESEPLLYMTQSRELKPLLKHPIFTSFLHLKWHKIRTYFYINVFLYTMFCIFFTFFILSTYANISTSVDPVTNQTVIQYPTDGGDNLVWSLVTVFLALLLLREFLQLTLSPKKYLLNPENWLEIGIIGITIAILFCQSCVKIKHQVSATGILLSWAELVLLIGRHPALSTNIEMFKTVSWNFLKFLAWYSILIIAFALSFHSLFRDIAEDDNSFDDPGVSIFKTVVMLTGEFDTGSIPFIHYPVTSHLLFVLFVFLIAIVLFNLLNGLAVSDTQVIKSDAELVSYISRVKLISYIERTLYNPSSCLTRSENFKTLFCCLSKIFNNKKKELFSKKINLFENVSNTCEIRISPNLENRVEMSYEKYTSKQNNRIDNFQNSSCIDNCGMVYMDNDILRTAKQILIEKQIKEEQERNNTRLLEKEQKLNQMLFECKETLEKNKEMLENITSLLYELHAK
ncbi:transient receptor potential cation channel protein painless [Cimex lectularius]|uniref:Ion transport domain-containing protein n=1 Tax=Cimex lectularius TaxID=79782 RepID=A0A8I6S650_CIMLE|nr:transient receptor potential cation channel protein painless [Cimex lectularius]